MPNNGVDSRASAGTDRAHPCDASQAGAPSFPRWYLTLALFLVGVNLRPALSSVAPVLADIREGIGLSSAGAGLLTTLPVFCFGAFAPLAPWLAGRLGPERTVFHCLILLTLALGLRVLFGPGALFLGTLAAGASIGVAMVLLPGIIKQDFARNAGSMMGVYTMALCLGAALSAGLTVPLEQAAGNSWRFALAAWLLPVLAAALAWYPRLSRTAQRTGSGYHRVSGLYADPLAWQVTAFMGFQSSLAYCIFGWLPTILIDRGMGPLAAGAMLSLSIGTQLITAFGGPWLASLGRDQRAAIVAMMLMSVGGFLGCIYGDLGTIWPWVFLLGLGQGGAFSIGLTLIVLRAPNVSVAASLSGMVQGIGYTIAALGPLAFGLLHDMSGNWDSTALFFTATALAALVAGLGAGRALYVKATVTES